MKKTYIGIALAIIFILILAVIVSVFDKKEEAPETAIVPETEIAVEVEKTEEVVEAVKKTDGEIIMERFQNLDWAEVHARAKSFGEEGWEEGIVLLASIPSADIQLFGYNDEEYQYRGVAIEHGDHVNYFDWVYVSDSYIQPEMYWKESENQLQITLNLSDGTGIYAEELHVLVEHETGTMEDFLFASQEYIAEIENRLEGTGASIGSYVNIKLGEVMMLQFEPVKLVDEEWIVMKLHQAVILLNPNKDGYVFLLDDIGVEPEKREAVVKIEGEKESFTEIEYVSNKGFSIWYPEMILEPHRIYSHDGFVIPNVGDNSIVKVTLVPEDEMELTDEYLKEAAANYKDSGEFKKVKISDIKYIKADDKNVKIRMIQVVHDSTTDRFYIVEGEERALLVTVSLPTESLEGMGVRVNKMLQTIAFTE